MKRKDRVVKIIFTCLLKCGHSTNAAVKKRAEDRFADFVPNSSGYEILSRLVAVENAYQKPKSRAQRVAHAVDAVRDAASDVGEVKEELESWKCGMEGTNLENTEKYGQLDEAVNLLDEFVSSCEDVAGNAESVEIPSMF